MSLMSWKCFMEVRDLALVLHKLTPPFNQAFPLFRSTQTCENPLGGALSYTKFDNKLNRVLQLNKISFYLQSFQKKFNLST
jgi:hypothetical protein